MDWMTRVTKRRRIVGLNLRPTLCALLLLVGDLSVLAGIAAAQTGVFVPVRPVERRPTSQANPVAAQRGFPQVSNRMTTQAVGVETTWAFRSRSPVALGSTMIRLGDVVEPLNPMLAAWKRLQNVPIGLLPTDGQPMTIVRNRLTEVITREEATPSQIQWYGPEEITVHYDANLAAMRTANQSVAQVLHTDSSSRAGGDVPTTGIGSPRAPSAVAPSAVAPSAVAPSQSTPVHTYVARASISSVESADSEKSLDAATAQRIRYWIELSINRDLKALREVYAISLDTDDSDLVPFVNITGIDRIGLAQSLGDQPQPERRVAATVVARHRSGPVTADIVLKLKPHPLAVVTARPLQRGELVQVSDIRLQPIPEGDWRDAFVSSPETLLGKEVRRILRADVPITASDVGPPILVRRGDLVELQVVGGAVVITTDAKSLGEAAGGEMIEIETMQPRRRLIAKVVRTGLVEIITRAPTVQ